MLVAARTSCGCSRLRRSSRRPARQLAEPDSLEHIIRTLRRLRRSARWQAMHRAAYKLQHERIAQRRREQLRTVLAPKEPERRELLAELLDEYIDLGSLRATTMALALALADPLLKEVTRRDGETARRQDG